MRLTDVQPGFQSQSRLTFDVELPHARYGTETRWAAFFDQARERLATIARRAIPEVD